MGAASRLALGDERGRRDRAPEARPSRGRAPSGVGIDRRCPPTRRHARPCPADVKVTATRAVEVGPEDPCAGVRQPLERRRVPGGRTGCRSPADAIATRGRTASTNAWVVAVRLP